MPQPDSERLRERLIQMTRDLILIESTDDRPEDRRRCFQLIRNHLEEIPGLEIRMLEKEGYESLLALPRGVTAPAALLCGHLDVVKHIVPGSYQSEVRDGRILGPGAGDMKGQLAIMIELMRQLGRDHPGLSLGLAITSDEERGGENGVRFLVEECDLRAGVAIIPDGGSLTDVTVEEKGILHLRLLAEGKAAHAARPWLGTNALERLVASVARVRAEFDGLYPDPGGPEAVDPEDTETHWFPTCSVTILSTSNDSPNRIPASAEATLDIRFVPPATSTDMIRKVEQCLEEGVVAEKIVAAEPTHLAPDDVFLSVIEEVTGVAPRLVKACGGSDGRFFCEREIPVLLSRPRVGNLHGRDEWIEIESMLSYYRICRRYLERILLPQT